MNISRQNVCIQAVSITIFEPKVVTISARNTIMRKFSNFVSLYFSHITTFFNQILNFTTFERFFPGIWFFRLDLSRSKIILVYNANCPLPALGNQVQMLPMLVLIFGFHES